ncbi:ribonuclease D [bacterium]|nr:ribonuclease D [bacterium]
MDWAKERKQQFLRNRAKGSPISSSSNNPESPIKTETEAWIETWYTPPSLPSRNARQRAVPSKALCQEATDIEDGEVKKVQEESQSELQALEPKPSPSPQSAVVLTQHPSTFEVGQKVVLRPNANRIPDGISLNAVLVIQEMYVNVYRQNQNIWCIWCSSDAFSGLKSIDSDCLVPLTEKVSNSDVERIPIMESEEFHAGIIDYVSSHAVVSYEFVEDGQRLAEILKPLQTCPVIAVDTETTGLDPLKDKIRLIQIAAENNPVIIVDLFKISRETLAPLAELFQGAPIKVLQNAKFDLKFLQQAGLPIAGKLFDTMVAAQLLDAGVRSHGYNLAELVKVYLGEELSKEQQRSDWSNSNLSSEQLEYAARDASILLRLREVMKPKLKNARLVETAKLEFDCLGRSPKWNSTGCCSISLYGMPYDKNLSKEEIN